MEVIKSDIGFFVATKDNVTLNIDTNDKVKLNLLKN